MDFIRLYKWAMHDLVQFGQSFGFHVTGELVMFEFWRMCFIKIKVSVKKKKPLPSESFHEVILRDHGRFLDSTNFATPDALEAEGLAAMDTLKSASEAFYIEHNST